MGIQRSYGNSLIHLLAGMVLLIGCSGDLSQITLFEDNFDQLPSGPVSNYSAEPFNYHEMQSFGALGNWRVINGAPFGDDLDAWEIVTSPSGNYLRQNSPTVDDMNHPHQLHVHPMIIAGDSLWADYKVTLHFSPHQNVDKCGVIFRYQNSRNYYFYGMEGNRLVIKKVQGGTAPGRPYEVILSSRQYGWSMGEHYKAEVSLKQGKIYTLLNDSISLIAQDQGYVRGKVGILSDVPAEFYSMEVGALKAEERKLSRAQSVISNELELRLSENPEMAFWGRVNTKGFGTGRNLGFSDLNNDGSLDLLLAQAVADRSGLPVVYSITAISTSGKLLWQNGTPDPERNDLSQLVALRIDDLDEDGKKEVYYISGETLIALDGSTGKEVRRIQLPRTKRYEAVNGIRDYLVSGKMSGVRAGRDLLIVTRSGDLLLLDQHLKRRWISKTDEVTQPFIGNFLDDNENEILMGGRIIGPNGEWKMRIQIPHGDQFLKSGYLPPDVMMDSTGHFISVAGEWGVQLSASAGEIMRQRSIGNVENLVVANLFNGNKELEICAINGEGSPGLLSFMDMQGIVHKQLETVSHGASLIPVNWKGDGEEYVMFSVHPGEGGLYDGQGRLCAVFPDDGHPEMCFEAFDIIGDERDELVVWDLDDLWIYTQRENDRNGRVYHPTRSNGLNAPIDQIRISLPDWDE